MATVKDTMNSLLDKLHLSRDAATPPKEPTEEELAKLRKIYKDADQDQVFTFYDELDVASKAQLFSQLSQIDPVRASDIAKEAVRPPTLTLEKPTVEPLPESAIASILDSDSSELDKAYDVGLELISQNKVAVILMAGGQGTRLGSSAPKGCFDIGLPSKKSLFQIQAERILKVQQLAQRKYGKEKVVVPWYVMTSGPTREPTEAFFKQHKYFGLEEENVTIFEQGVLPCFTNDGMIMLETKSKVAVAPDGNGGIYQALIVSNVRADMEKRGIQHVHAYCVDNCLVKVADPVFIGFAASKDVDIATKVVRKRNAHESVGLIILKDGNPDVVEYSEIDKATAEATDPKQPDILKFRAGNIVNHYYSFRFLQSIEQWMHQLPHHVAKKKIPFTDIKTGEYIKPKETNGIKLEQFVFDVFKRVPLEKFASLEVKREDEFSPLKNARGTGEDDPDTSKRDILSQGTRWVKAAGGIVVSEGDTDTGVEVSPLISYAGEGLNFLKGRTIKAPAVIEKED